MKRSDINYYMGKLGEGYSWDQIAEVMASDNQLDPSERQKIAAEIDVHKTPGKVVFNNILNGAFPIEEDAPKGVDVERVAAQAGASEVAKVGAQEGTKLAIGTGLSAAIPAGRAVQTLTGRGWSPIAAQSVGRFLSGLGFGAGAGAADVAMGKPPEEAVVEQAMNLPFFMVPGAAGDVAVEALAKNQPLKAALTRMITQGATAAGMTGAAGGSAEDMALAGVGEAGAGILEGAGEKPVGEISAKAKQLSEWLKSQFGADIPAALLSEKQSPFGPMKGDPIARPIINEALLGATEQAIKNTPVAVNAAPVDPTAMKNLNTTLETAAQAKQMEAVGAPTVAAESIIGAPMSTTDLSKSIDAYDVMTPAGAEYGRLTGEIKQKYGNEPVDLTDLAAMVNKQPEVLQKVALNLGTKNMKVHNFLQKLVDPKKKPVATVTELYETWPEINKVSRKTPKDSWDQAILGMVKDKIDQELGRISKRIGDPAIQKNLAEANLTYKTGIEKQADMELTGDFVKSGAVNRLPLDFINSADQLKGMTEHIQRLENDPNIDQAAVQNLKDQWLMQLAERSGLKKAGVPGVAFNPEILRNTVLNHPALLDLVDASKLQQLLSVPAANLDLRPLKTVVDTFQNLGSEKALVAKILGNKAIYTPEIFTEINTLVDNNFAPADAAKMKKQLRDTFWTGLIGMDSSGDFRIKDAVERYKQIPQQTKAYFMDNDPKQMVVADQYFYEVLPALVKVLDEINPTRDTNTSELSALRQATSTASYANWALKGLMGVGAYGGTVSSSPLIGTLALVPLLLQKNAWKAEHLLNPNSILSKNVPQLANGLRVLVAGGKKEVADERERRR